MSDYEDFWEGTFEPSPYLVTKTTLGSVLNFIVWSSHGERGATSLVQSTQKDSSGMWQVFKLADEYENKFHHSFRMGEYESRTNYKGGGLICVKESSNVFLVSCGQLSNYGIWRD